MKEGQIVEDEKTLMDKVDLLQKDVSLLTLHL